MDLKKNQIPDLQKVVSNPVKPGVYSEMWSDIVQITTGEDPSSIIQTKVNIPYKGISYTLSLGRSQEDILVGTNIKYQNTNFLGEIQVDKDQSISIQTYSELSKQVLATLGFTHSLENKIINYNVGIQYSNKNCGMQLMINNTQGLSATYLQTLTNSLHVGSEVWYDCFHHNDIFFSTAIRYTNPIATFIMAYTSSYLLCLHYLQAITDNLHVAANANISLAFNPVKIDCSSSIGALFIHPQSGIKLLTNVNLNGVLKASLSKSISKDVDLSLMASVNPFNDKLQALFKIHYGSQEKKKVSVSPLYSNHINNNKQFKDFTHLFTN
ncbi:hypothetical protein WA158_007792 [Blastocystis sp. Blastoise]